jgi:hypothetical protein
LESNIDVEQFMTTIYRYIQLGIHVRARYDKQTGKFMREVCEVCEFYVTEDNKPEFNIIYRKNIDGSEVINSPSPHLIDYLESQGVDLNSKNFDGLSTTAPDPFEENKVNNSTVSSTQSVEQTSIVPNLNSTSSDEEEEIL